MLSRKKLFGRRIAVLAADGFEKVELSVPVAAYRQEGAKVDIISLRPGKIRGMNLHEPASKIRVSKTVQEANVNDYDGLLIPGGFINPDLLRQSAEARQFVRVFDGANKSIATLCHGPWLLASAGLLQGRRISSWPGIRDDLVHAGAIWLDQDVVRDGNIVSSRGPQDLMPFVRASINLFAEAGSLPDTTSQNAISSPQRDHPPRVVLKTMQFVPRPSLRTALGIGALFTLIFWTRQRPQHGVKGLVS